MKPSIIQERNAKQDLKIQAALFDRFSLFNPDFQEPCKIEKKQKKHYYRGKVEPLHRIVYMIATGRELEKNKRVIRKCGNNQCSEVSHLYDDDFINYL
jgi:hypothetical protein